MIKTVKVSLFQ